MKVLHVVEAMVRGGAESMVVEHVRHAGPGVASFVCALNGGGPALKAAQSHGAHVFDMGNRTPRGAWGRFDRLGRLIRILRAVRPDAVNAHNPTGSLYGVPAARIAGVPAVLRTEHSIHDPSRHSGFYLRVEPRLTAWSSRVIGVCEAVRESHASRLSNWSSRFVTIANGISPVDSRRPRGETRAALGLAEADRVAFTAASLSPQKAQHVLLEAFAAAARKVGDARLVIAGGGPLRDELGRQAEQLGVAGRASFLGPRDDVADLMAAADLYVLTSVREGLSITLLEAMQARLPLVATDVGGNRELVRDGKTGRLVPVGDVPALAAALEALLGDAQLAAGMGNAGEKLWSERYRAERMVSETEALYREVLAEKRR